VNTSTASPSYTSTSTPTTTIAPLSPATVSITVLNGYYYGFGSACSDQGYGNVFGTVTFTSTTANSGNTITMTNREGGVTNVYGGLYLVVANTDTTNSKSYNITFTNGSASSPFSKTLNANSYHLWKCRSATGINNFTISNSGSGSSIPSGSQNTPLAWNPGFINGYFVTGSKSNCSHGNNQGQTASFTSSTSNTDNTLTLTNGNGGLTNSKCDGVFFYAENSDPLNPKSYSYSFTNVYN
jgi:hypothetical protein